MFMCGTAAVRCHNIFISYVEGFNINGRDQSNSPMRMHTHNRGLLFIVEVTNQGYPLMRGKTLNTEKAVEGLYIHV